MKGTILLLLALAVPFSLGSPVQAQTLDDAYAFYDQTMLNGASTLGKGDLGGGYFKIAPSSSVSGSCKSTVVGVTGVRVEFDWSKVVDTPYIYPDRSIAGLYIIGGGYLHTDVEIGSLYTGPVQFMMVFTGSTAMDDRLRKAIDVLRQGCAKSSFGF